MSDDSNDNKVSSSALEPPGLLKPPPISVQLDQIVDALSRFNTLSSAPIMTFDDDDDDDDEDDGDGDGDVQEDVDDEEETPTLQDAMQDPLFPAMCAWIGRNIDQIWDHATKKSGNPPLGVTRTTQAALIQFVYEIVWLPTQGYVVDEDDPTLWLKNKK
jgi:hypothetical protein